MKYEIKGATLPVAICYLEDSDYANQQGGRYIAAIYSNRQ